MPNSPILSSSSIPSSLFCTLEYFYSYIFLCSFCSRPKKTKTIGVRCVDVGGDDFLYSQGARPPRDFINKLMGINFGVMESLGDGVMRPFLQDVVKFGSLGQTLVTMAVQKPLFVPQILLQAGPGPIVDWFGHFTALAAYDVAAGLAESGPASALCKAVVGKE